MSMLCQVFVYTIHKLRVKQMKHKPFKFKLLKKTSTTNFQDNAKLIIKSLVSNKLHKSKQMKIQFMQQLKPKKYYKTT